MLVPDVVAASTSPSPANVPAVIFTVALANVRLSGSDTTAADDSVFAPAFSVKLAVAATVAVGGSFTPTTVTVAVCGALVSSPSFTTQVSERALSEPKLVGFSLVDVNFTDWRTVW